jgi:hypothetical protein
LVSICMSVAILHPSLSWRLSGPLPLFLAFFCLLLWQQFMSKRIRHKKADLLLICCLLVLAWVPVGFKILPLLKIKQPAELIRLFPAGDAMAWLRLNEIKEKIAASGNAELYYLSGFDVQFLEGSPALDAELLEIKSTSLLVQKLYSLNFRWLLETKSEFSRGIYAHFFRSLAVNDIPSRDCIAFEGLTGRVWDLTKLKKRIEAADYKDPPFKALVRVLEQQK